MHLSSSLFFFFFFEISKSFLEQNVWSEEHESEVLKGFFFSFSWRNDSAVGGWVKLCQRVINNRAQLNAVGRVMKRWEFAQVKKKIENICIYKPYIYVGFNSKTHLLNPIPENVQGPTGETWSNLGEWRCPCPLQERNWRIFKVPSNPKHPGILWKFLGRSK